MSRAKRVVISGIGPVCKLGIGKESFWDNLLQKKIEISSIPESFDKNYRFKSRHYVPYPDFSLTDYGLSRKYIRLMGDTAKMAILSSLLALKDAGLVIDGGSNITKNIKTNTEIILGVGVGNLFDAAKAYMTHIFYDSPEILSKHQLSKSFDRMCIPGVMHNSASAWVSIILGIKGANYTINASCASGSYAIGQAFTRIKEGHTKMALTGGVECLKDGHGSIMRGFDSLGALSRSVDGQPMPFSNDRSGFLYSDGAGCILLLEEMEMAIKRGAHIYAEIVNYKSNSDAYNIVQIDSEGQQIGKMIRDTIENNSVDYFNTHGTGTVLNDKIEAELIQNIFGSKQNQPFINSSKGILGHTIGASGALEIAITALSIERSWIHGNLLKDPMDNLNLPVDSINTNVDYALSTSYGFGGHNAAILLKKFHPN
jgi:3-oxoacyl-[acyl-carrier-protein] synthase II